MAALCGSLVSKPEDTAKAVQPIMYIGLIGYMIGITFGTNDPQNIVVKVTSFIPLISSYIMPVRLATETASTMEAIVSLVILAVFWNYFNNLLLVYINQTFLYTAKAA